MWTSKRHRNWLYWQQAIQSIPRYYWTSVEWKQEWTQFFATWWCSLREDVEL